MLKLNDITVKFEHNDVVHEVKELTISQLSEIEKESKELSELELYILIMKKAGLSDEVCRSLTIRQLKLIVDALNEVKKSEAQPS